MRGPRGVLGDVPFSPLNDVYSSLPALGGDAEKWAASPWVEVEIPSPLGKHEK